MNIKKTMCLILCALILLLSSNIILAEEKVEKPKIEETSTTSYDKNIKIEESTLSTINMKVNGKQLSFPDQKPVVMDDRTYVPVRFLAEALGAEVSWDDNNKVVVIKNKGIQDTNDYLGQYSVAYYLKLGENKMVWAREAYNQYYLYPKIADKAIVYDLPNYPILMSDRTMLPFRFIAEILGAFVYYDSTTHTAFLESTSYKDGSNLGPYPIFSSLFSPYILKALNDFRTKNGKMPVALDPSLTDAATWKVRDMAFNDYFDHKNTDGTFTGGRFFSLYNVNGGKNRICGEDLTTTSFGTDTQQLIYDADSLYGSDAEATKKRLAKDLIDLYNELKNSWGINFPTPNVSCPYEKCKYKEINPNHKVLNFAINKEFYEESLIKPSETAAYQEPMDMVIHFNEDLYRYYAEATISSFESSPSHKYAMLSSFYQTMGYGTARMPNKYSSYAVLLMEQVR